MYLNLISRRLTKPSKWITTLFYMTETSVLLSRVSTFFATSSKHEKYYKQNLIVSYNTLPSFQVASSTYVSRDSIFSKTCCFNGGNRFFTHALQ